MSEKEALTLEEVRRDGKGGVFVGACHESRNMLFIVSAGGTCAYLSKKSGLHGFLRTFDPWNSYKVKPQNVRDLDLVLE